MIGDISLATNIYIITGYTDMRRSIDGLYAIVMDKLGEEPDRFSIYLFCECTRQVPLAKERRRGQIHHLAAARLAHDRP